MRRKISCLFLEMKPGLPNHVRSKPLHTTGTVFLITALVDVPAN
jgi:hypothetical protein